jgi:hypothetical protein
MSRVPATGRDAQALLAQLDLQPRSPRTDGSRAHADTSTDGGMAPRWVLIASASRLPQAQRTVDKP